MSDFMQFYANGGIFNHFTTIFMAIGVTALILHGRARKLGAHSQKRLVLADRMAAICVFSGLCGTVFGVMEVGAALQNVPPEELLKAGARGMSIAVMTLGWALMCAIPMLTASAILRYREPAAPRREQQGA